MSGDMQTAVVNAVVEMAEREGGMENCYMMPGRKTWHDCAVSGLLWYNAPLPGTNRLTTRAVKLSGAA
jgi:hypothetical protein